MGYKPAKKVYNLEFVDHPGLEVSCKGATLGEITDVQKMNVNVHEKDDEKRMEVFRFFAGKLLTWNLEHPDTDLGGPCPLCGLEAGMSMPTTLDGMLCLELDLIIAIITGWVFAVARVSLPKELSLNAGGRNGPASLLPDGMTAEITKRLEEIQNPGTLPMLS